MQLLWNEALQITEFKSNDYKNQQISTSSEHLKTPRQELLNLINTTQS